MLRVLLRRSGLLLALTLLPFQGRAMAADAPLPLASFFQYSEFSGAVLSPDGRHIAMKVGSSDLPMMLVAMDVETLQPKILAKARSDVDQIRWISDQRLVFTFSDRQIASGDQIVGPGLFAINLDGSELRELVSRSYAPVTHTRPGSVLAPNVFMLANLGRQDSDTIYVRSLRLDANREQSVELLRLNTLSGSSRPVAGPAAHTSRWLLDETGEPRLAQSVDGNRVLNWYKDPLDGQWRKLYENRMFGDGQIEPLSFGQNGKLYALARNGQDKRALYTYDIARQALDAQAVVALQDYDFNGTLIFEGENGVGVDYLSDTRTTLWLAPKYESLQKRVDALLPGTHNHLSFGRRSQTPYLLVHASSDAEPGATYLFNSASGKLTALGRALPEIDPARMAHKQLIRYPARDGFTIPAYLTLPRDAGDKPLPMVVLVHGGPWARVDPDWNGVSQFLASRGYAVLEPQFRGSAGLGNRHMVAGFRQWGLAMQNDLADGARAMIARHVASPLNICIVGAGYGGYASMMGLINNPELFRCGVSYGGPTSLDLLYSSRWNQSSDTQLNVGLPVTLGDPVRDAAQLTATSPLAQAARLRQPLLLAYGSRDRNVPPIHGERLRDALLPLNPGLEWIEYDGEGGTLSLVKNRVDYWSRVEKFLNANIGGNSKK